MAKYNKQISLGYDDSGKRIRKWAHGDTKSELNQNIYNIKKEYETIKNPSNITFEKYSEKWINTYKSMKSPRTYEMYEYLIKKCDSIKYMRMDSIKRIDLQNIIAHNQECPNLCRKIKTCLNQIFNSALADGIISTNPAFGVETPKNKVSEKRAFTQLEKECINSIDFQDDRTNVFVKTLLNFGLRPGEALALTKDSFDFSNNLLTIDKAVTFISNSPILKGTKTGATRKLPIPDNLVPMYKKYLKECDKYLFAQKTNNNNLMSKTSFRLFKERIFERINYALGGNKEFDLLNGMTLYTFRHNKATALYYLEGISMKTKAAYMGHSVQMLMNIYSHIDEIKENAKKLSECIF